MIVVSIYRTEADADASRRHDDDPFDGHEIAFVTVDERDANSFIKVRSSQHPSWQFHIEEI